MHLSGKLFYSENNFFDTQLELPIGKVYQVSELSVIRGGEIPLHNQVCDEITYVISGSAKCYCGENFVNLKEGEIHFIKRGNSHRIEVSKDENFRYMCIGFIPNEENLSVYKFLKEAEGKEHFAVEDNGTVKSLSELLIREFYNSDENAKEMIDDLMLRYNFSRGIYLKLDLAAVQAYGLRYAEGSDRVNAIFSVGLDF